MLTANDLGRWTQPAPGLYPHQWLWDSCFTAIGLAHISPQRAAVELTQLAKGQWQDGMMPHMIYAPKLSSRMESMLWGKTRSPKGVRTSGITQPPLLAVAVERVAHALGPVDGRKFVRDMLPVLLRYHSWLYQNRDPTGSGLVVCLHSWESGMDDSPYWTDAMIHLPQLPLRARWLHEYRLVNPDERASSKNLQHMLALVYLLREYDYDSRKVIAQSPIAVTDLAFNAILAAANESLERLADLVDIEIPDSLYRRFSMTRRGLETLWDDESKQYFSRDHLNGHLIRSPTVSTFMPLFAGTASPSRAEELRQMLVNEQGYNVPHPLPSVPTTSPDFEERRYWRGPVWVNMNWFVIQGLLRYGFTEEAEWLRVRTLGLTSIAGFREYYDPLTGEGLGAHSFSWTAALALDLSLTDPGRDVEIE